jgi:8-oxo-dGTP pyrophosphatase MutT (NUDIX family)
MMIEYVVGFYFDLGRNSVVLIRKDHPEWQAGLLNGVGGKIEGEETPLRAMQREFLEETGKQVDDWNLFTSIRGKEYRIFFFYALADKKCPVIFGLEELGIKSTLKNEPLILEDVMDVINGQATYELASDVPWLVAMADSFARGSHADPLIIIEPEA